MPPRPRASRHDQQRVQHVVAEPPRRWLAVQRQVAREGRDEGRAHRAFGEEIADQIGNAERDVERVHLVAGAEERRQHLIADETEDAARQRRDAGEPADRARPERRA